MLCFYLSTIHSILSSGFSGSLIFKTLLYSGFILPVIFLSVYRFAPSFADKKWGKITGGHIIILQTILVTLAVISGELFYWLFPLGGFFMSLHKNKRFLSADAEAGVLEETDIERPYPGKNSKDLIKQNERLGHELRLLKQQLESSQKLGRLGSYEWDLFTNVVTGTKEYKRIWELEKEPIYIDDIFTKIFSDDIKTIRSQVDKQMHDFEPLDIVYRIHSSDKPGYKVLHSRTEVVIGKEGKPVKMVGIVQEITEQKQTEEKLIRQTIELKRKNRDIHQFLIVSSHDLKEPLRKLQTFSELLLTEAKSKLEDKYCSYLDTIKRSSEHLQKLIEDLTLLIKVGTRNDHFAETDIRNLILGVFEDLELHAHDINLELEVIPSMYVLPDQFRLLVKHLLINAVKYKKKEEPCRIRIFSQRLSKEDVKVLHRLTDEESALLYPYYCSICFQDNGIGFEEKYLHKIFNVFQQLHNRGQYAGTGIGLAICKKVVDNHYGFITAKSILNSGSTFIISIPEGVEKLSLEV